MNFNNDNSNIDLIFDWVLNNNDNNAIKNFENDNSFMMTNQVFDNSINTGSKKDNTSNSEEDELTEEQLKLLPSKERRQLRNKISARNFRTRRKEYMASLESKIEKYQAENNQLKLEVKWVREMMEKLQTDNDKLRFELLLCKGGISTTSVQSSTTTPMNDLFYTGTQNSLISNQTTVPSTNNVPTTPFITPVTTANIDSHSANQESSLIVSRSSTEENSNDVYLSFASLPNWNISNILDKEKNKAPSAELIRSYPLLAPALMSIIIQHTMTLTPKELLINNFDATLLPYRQEDKFMNSLSNIQLWENILTSTKDEQTVKQEKVETYNKEHIREYIQNHCPLHWLQKQFCKFILLQVVSRYPSLNEPCRTYLPICEKYKIRR